MSDGPRIIPIGDELPPMDVDRSRPACDSAGPPKRTAKHGDRFAVLNSFADYGARLVDTTAQACWWILYRETKPDGLARVSQGQIAKCIGLSRWAVNRALRRLELAGLLTVIRRGGLRGGASTYRIRPTQGVAPAPQGGVAPAPQGV